MGESPEDELPEGEPAADTKDAGDGPVFEAEPLHLGDWVESWLSSSLDVVTVVELITIIVGAQLTGALVVQGPGGSRRLFFEEGRFFGGRSDQKEDRLGEVLWRHGRISLDQLMIAGEMVTPEKRLGRVLIELGFISANELRGALRGQAREVFEATCLEENGRATFFPGQVSDNPVAFFEGLEDMIDAAIQRIEERQLIRQRLGDLGRAFLAVEPAPQGAGQLSEAASALNQLVRSSKSELDGHTLLEKANLRTLSGLRALLQLIEAGWIEPREPTMDLDELDVEPLADGTRLERLCEALRLVMEKLDDSPFGLGEAVREYCADPPQEVEGALSGVDVDDLDSEALKKHGELFIDGGMEALERGLSLMLDFAVFEARDCMPENQVNAIVEAIAHLDVL